MKKSLFLGFAFAALMLIASPDLHAVTIIQGAGEDYVKFQAGDYDSLVNAPTSVITDNGDGTLSTTMGNTNNSNTAVLTYSLTFDAAGDYYLYFRSRSSDLNTDSIYVISDFDTTPSGTTINAWNNLHQSGSHWTILDNGSGGDPGVGTGVRATLTSGAAVYNNTAAVGQFFTVSAEQVGDPVTFILRAREPGLLWESFVFSTDADLTATELNELAFSQIPEPTSAALLLGALCVVMLQRRRVTRL